MDREEKKCYFNRYIKLSLKRAQLLSTYHNGVPDNQLTHRGRTTFEFQELHEITSAPGDSSESALS